MTKEEIEVGDLVEHEDDNKIYRVQKITKEMADYYFENVIDENIGKLVIDINICNDSYYSYVVLLSDNIDKITKIYRKNDKGDYMLIWRKCND